MCACGHFSLSPSFLAEVLGGRVWAAGGARVLQSDDGLRKFPEIILK